MARPHIAMRKIRDVLRLRFGEGLSLRRVALSVDLPHTTVAEYVRRADRAGLGWPLPDGLDDAGLESRLFASAALPVSAVRPLPDYARVHSELRRKGVTLALLWIEYREVHPDGLGYSQFCDRYRRWRRHLDVVMRQSHKAGEKMFVDFPGMRIPIWDARLGEVVFEAELFVAVLGASSYLYATAVASQGLSEWVTAHVAALEFFGGCPEIVVPDNLRSGVTRAHRYEPELNATYAEMAAHYSMTIIPARAYKPRDKAKAEGGVLLAERWIIARLRNCRFGSLGEANTRIAELVEWLNNRPFRKIDGSRASLYETVDRPALGPLPAARYEFATWRRAKIGLDYHIEVRSERHFYSVPYRLVGETVEVRLAARTVEVFFASRRVAAHPRAHKPGYTTDPAHMPDSHRRHGEWTPARLVDWAARTGPATAKLVEEIMAARRHPEQGFRSCLGIMRLGGRYGTDRLEAAAVRALAVRALSYRSIESILANGLDRRPLPAETPPVEDHHPHPNLRGGDYYQ